MLHNLLCTLPPGEQPQRTTKAGTAFLRKHAHLSFAATPQSVQARREQQVERLRGAVRKAQAELQRPWTSRPAGARWLNVRSKLEDTRLQAPANTTATAPRCSPCVHSSLRLQGCCEPAQWCTKGIRTQGTLGLDKCCQRRVLC